VNYVVRVNATGTNVKSAPTTFNSTTIAGCSLWLDAADPLNNGTTPANGTTITTWYDKSGSGRNATTSGSTYNTAGINGKPAMTLSGTQNFYGSVPITGNTLTVFAIVTMNSSSSATARIIGLAGDVQGNSDYSNNSYITLQRGDASFIIQRNSVVVGSSSSTSYSTPYLVECWVDGTNEYVTIQSGSTTNIGSAASTGNFAISAYTIGGNVYGSLNGFISEIIVYNTSLTTTQRQQIEGYLSWKWGLQANLPSSHPYCSLFLPMSAPGCLLWLDASDPLNNGTPPSSGTSITTWYDKSGSGRNATASGTITYNATGINGKPAMTLGGSQNFYGSVPITGNTLTVFAIVTMNSSSSATARIIGLAGDVQGNSDYSNNSYITLQRGDASFIIQRNSVVVGSSSSTSYSTPYLVECWVDGTNEYVTIQSGSTTNIGSAASTGNFAISAYTIGGNVYGSLNGFISEIIVYNTSLTTTQRQQIEGYLSWKWGLQANLPSTHPYYSSVPTAIYSLSPNYSAGTTVASLADFPTNLTLISSTANSLTFSFTAPSTGVTPSSYTPYVNGSIGTGSGTPSSYTVTGLTAGTVYSISLYANLQPQTIVPTSITGCLLWLDANDSTTITYSSGSNLSQWADKSGLGNNMTQGTVASQPVYGTMSNGKPGLNLASNKFMANNTIALPTSYSVFAVGYGTGASNGRLLTGTADGYIFFGADSTGSNFASYVGNGSSWSNAVANSPNYNVNSLCLMEMTNNSTSNELLPYFNGNAQTGKYGGVTKALTGLTFGSNPGGGAQFWNGYVAEVLVYNTVLSKVQRQQVEGYLSWKWGLQANLPSSHPYYSFLPLSLTGCVLWLDAADSTTIVQSASKVSQWNDKSGSGYSVVQPTSANQPTYTTNLLNGNAGIALSGTTWLYQSGNNVPNFSSSSATSVFIVARNDSSLSSGGWSVINSLYINSSNAVSSTARYQLSFAINTTLGVNVWSNQALTGQSGAVGYGANALIGFTTSSTSSVISVNGTSASYGGVTLANANNSSTLLIIGDSRLNYIKDSVIYEMIGFNVQLTTTQQQQVEGYLAWKWGLQANLPTSHPYSSVAPGTNRSPTSSLSTVPGPPTALTFIGATSTTITFSFTPPSGTITGYTPYINGFVATGSGTASSYTITGLTAATSYNVTMTASNSSGSSAQSSSVVFSTANNPPPGFISVQSITATSIKVAFTAPTGSVTSYLVTATPSTGSAITATGTVSPITINGLASGTRYIITLQSIFNAISSSVSNGIAVATTPSQPTVVSLSSITISSVAVNFSLVAGATSYTASASPTAGGSTITATGSTSPITISGLSSNTTYNVVLSASNGTSSSNSIAISLLTLPDASTIVIGTPTTTSSSITVPFTGPSGNGSITGYTATINPGSIVQPFSTSPLVISSGLSAGTTYTITIRATNSAGTSSNNVSTTVSTTVSPYTQTGAAVTTNGNITTLTYTSSAAAGSSVQNVGTFTMIQTYATVNILLVSGGGGGGAWYGKDGEAGGGGGGGNVRILNLTPSTIAIGTSFSVNIGTGGSGATVVSFPSTTLATNGLSSYLGLTAGSITYNSTTYTSGQSITATNNGTISPSYGGYYVTYYPNGTPCSGAGAGGGGGGGGDPGAGGSSMYGLGNGSGGNGGWGNQSGNAAGGGGGSSGVGNNSNNQGGGNGGAGTLCSFNSTYYGGGGAGGISGGKTFTIGTYGAGGTGGGGNTQQNGAAGGNGNANTGGGGAGASNNGTSNSAGGNGANGIVIIQLIP
jgi:hypothetical protein